jgi:hypothetical protein
MIFHDTLEIFNVFFSTGNITEDWRETKVFSILKPGKKPGIAGLSCVRIFFEKMICIRLDYWVERFDILSPSQVEDPGSLPKYFGGQRQCAD